MTLFFICVIERAEELSSIVKNSYFKFAQESPQQQYAHVELKYLFTFIFIHMFSRYEKCRQGSALFDVQCDMDSVNVGEALCMAVASQREWNIIQTQSYILINPKTCTS